MESERTFRISLRVNGRHRFPIPLEDLCRYLDRCFELRSQPRVSELALEYGMTVGKMSHLFQAAFGANLSRVMKTAQITLSQRLLLTSELNVDEVAARAAFTSPRAFFRLFKKMTGCSPQQYRLQVRDGLRTPPSNGNGVFHNGVPVLELWLQPDWGDRGERADADSHP